MRVPFSLTSTKKYDIVYHYGGSSISGISSDAFHTSETITGVRRKKPLGWREPTNYSFTRTHWSKADGIVTFKNSSYSNSYVGCVGGSRWNSLNKFNEAYTWSSFPTSLKNTALIKARLQMQDGEVNYGQAIAESNQTARLVGSTCKRFLTAIRAVRRGDAKKVAQALTNQKKTPRKLVKKVQKTLNHHRIAKLRIKESAAEALRQDKSIHRMKNVTGAWLELQYGWKPLIDDIDGTLANLNGYDAYQWIFTAKGSARQEIRVDRGIQASYFSSFASGYCDVKGFNVCKYVLIGVPSKTPSSIANDLGLTNLPLLAWELTPFSFVVDWLLPVGNFLDSLDACLGYDSLRTVCIEFTQIHWKEVGDMSCPHKVTVIASSFSGHKDYVRHVRTVTNGVPLPTRPSIKDPRSFLHMANSLALLVQVFAPGKSSVR